MGHFEDKIEKENTRAAKSTQSVEDYLAKGGKIETIIVCKSFGTKSALSYAKCKTCIQGNKEKCMDKKAQKVAKKATINKTHKTKENTMGNAKVAEMIKNFVVGVSDARLVIGNLKKAKPAAEAVAAVEGVKAVEATKAVKANKKEGIEAVKAVAAVTGVKAVAAVEAKEATKNVQTVHLDCATVEIFEQVRARMADQGFSDNFEGQNIKNGDRFRLSYNAENDKIIRAAFKKCKSTDGYNADGLAAAKEAKKADAKAAKAEAKAKKDAEAEAKAGDEKSGDDAKDEDDKEESDDETPESDDEWPEEE